MPQKPTLTLACGDYEIIRPLLRGKVEVDGVDLTILTDMDSATRHWRFINNGEFDIAEVSASSYLAARDNDLPFRAIPVFLHRRFRHGFMFINTSKGIKKPADLKGCRIGVKTMMTTAVLWMRGILQSEYGVPLSSIEWIAEIEDDVKVSLPPDIKYSCLPNDKSVETMLAEGELDAVFHSNLVKPFLAKDPRVARLFPDHKAEEMAYFKRTGIFPIMHVLGLRKSLAEEHPWFAVNLFRAFNEAKAIAMKRMANPRIVPSVRKTFASAAVALAVGLTGAQAQEKVWKHGILEAKSDAGFIAMVDKGGFAAKRGLKVELLQIKAGATLMKALLSGEIDSVDMGAAESIVAGARGTGVKIVGCGWPGVPQVVLAKAEIKSLADLKGRTVAISSPGSLPDLLFRGMLNEANVPFADVNLATQGADLDRYKSLVAGITDAAVVSNEFEAVMPSNIKVLAKGSSAVPNFLRLCVATSAKVLSERRDDLVKFVAAEMDAYKFALANRAETIKVSQEMTHAKPDDKRAEFITDEAIRDKQIDPTLSIPLDRLDWMQNLFLKAGVIKETVPIESIVDKTVNADAAKIAGK